MKKSTELEKEIKLKSKFSIYTKREMRLLDLLKFHSTSRLQKVIKWDQTKKSQYIESLLLCHPLTNFMIQGDYCNHAIIDGYERLTSIKEYIENGLELQDLRMLTSLYGTKFQNLTSSRQKEFKEQKFKVVILDNVIPDYIVNYIYNSI